MKIFQDLLDDDSGATAIEYGLIAALVSVAIIGVLQALSGNLSATFTAVSDGLVQATEDAEGGTTE